MSAPCAKVCAYSELEAWWLCEVAPFPFVGMVQGRCFVGECWSEEEEGEGELHRKGGAASHRLVRVKNWSASQQQKSELTQKLHPYLGNFSNYEY